MKEFWDNIWKDLQGSSTTSKLVALLVTLSVVGAVGVGTWVAKRPHFASLYSSLDDVQMARVTKALAEQGIDFEVSPPPGPFVVYVDRGVRYEAFRAVATAGALDRMQVGIASGTEGLGSVFIGRQEREQIVQKRLWEETERLLETLAFVSQARVQTSEGESSPFGRSARTTGSVTLTLRGTGRLDKLQAQSVARLVRFGLGIEAEDLVILDQTGQSVYDGEQLGSENLSGEWLEHKTHYDQELATSANELLASVLGESKARVVVNSEWNFDLSSKISESIDPKQRVVLSEESSSSETPQGASPSVGGPAGVSSSLPSTTPNADPQAAAPTPRPAEKAKTSDKNTTYLAPKEVTTQVKRAPTLDKLFVSLFLDESLAEQRDDLESGVKAAIGFDEARADVFMTTLIAFQGEATELEGDGAAGTGETSDGPSPMVEMLLERGVEIASALVFAFLLLKTLKGAKKTTAAPVAPEEPEVDPEELAKAQIEELLTADPEKVGQILSSWALEDRPLARSGK